MATLRLFAAAREAIGVGSMDVAAPDVRGVIAMLLWLGTIAILAGQLTALAWILNVVAGVHKTAGTIIGGVVATVM